MSLTTSLNVPAQDTVATAPESEIQGLPRLVLITHGRYSGKSEATLLSYQRYGNDFVVIATNARRKSKPDWYMNLKEEPIVQIEISDASFYARASTPTGRERVRLLPLVAEMMDGFDTSVPRETAAIVLSPIC